VGMGLLFALVFGLLLPKDPGAALRAPDLRTGVTVTALLMLGSFVVDLRGIRDRPFAWIRDINQSAMDRMGVIIFTLFFGLVAFATLDAPMAFFWVFTAFKLFAEIVRALPQRKRSAELSPWLQRISGKFKNELLRERRKELKREERQAAKDEEALPIRD